MPELALLLLLWPDFTSTNLQKVGSAYTAQAQ